MNLGATLYVEGSDEAVRFYCRAFGMAVGYNVRRPDGAFLHAELCKEGRSVFAVSESAEAGIREAMLAAGRPTMSYGVDLESEEALRRAFSVLSEGGHVLRPLGALPWCPCSADLVDRFGVCWYIFVTQAAPSDAAMEEYFRNDPDGMSAP